MGQSVEAAGSARAGDVVREREEEVAGGLGLRQHTECRDGGQTKDARWALLQGRILLGPEGVPLRRVDVLAANGVIHMLEGILLPPTILPILPKICNEEQHKVVAVRRDPSSPCVSSSSRGQRAFSVLPK